MNENGNNEGEKQWFVLRVTYQRELIAKKLLDELGYTCFVPTKVVRKVSSSGRRIVKRESALHNFIFLQSDKETIDSIKQTRIPWLRYVMHNDTVGKRRVPMTVREKQMRSFIAVAGSDDERIDFLNEEEARFCQGDKVRIISGMFEGVEGIFVKRNNKRGKCVVVRIDGVAAVATATIPGILVEKTE